MHIVKTKLAEFLEADMRDAGNPVMRRFREAKPTDREKAFVETLAETRCRVMPDEVRGELISTLPTMRRGHIKIMISELVQHTRRYEQVCNRCLTLEREGVGCRQT